MEYECSDRTGRQKRKWTGELDLLDKNGQNWEVGIRGRGTYFHAVVGKYQYGNYICIPGHGVGCELSDHADVFWNQERLHSQLNKTDSITVACALPHLKEL